MEKTGLQEKYHYSGPSGGGGGHGYGGGGGASSGHHVYSTMGGHSGYGYGHQESSHHSSGSSKKSVALSALTLLAFLFFLHILQTCLQDQMNQQEQSTQVVMMAARGESKMGLKQHKGDIDIEYDVDDEYKQSREVIYNKEPREQSVNTRSTDHANKMKQIP